MDENERVMAERPVSRRTMLKGVGAGALAVGAGQVVSQLAFAKPAFSATSSTPIKIGYISPKTGSFADFSISDSYVLSKIRCV